MAILTLEQLHIGLISYTCLLRYCNSLVNRRGVSPFQRVFGIRLTDTSRV